MDKKRNNDRDYYLNLKFQTKLCRHYFNGHCNRLIKCDFAHGRQELRHWKVKKIIM